MGLKLGQNANTGGIWNSVMLIITNGVVPARVKVSYEFYNETECGLNIKLKLLAADGDAKKEELKAVIVSPDGEEIVIKRNPVFSHGVNKISLITKISNPQLWYRGIWVNKNYIKWFSIMVGKRSTRNILVSEEWNWIKTKGFL
jgi:hypothetical protein